VGGLYGTANSKVTVPMKFSDYRPISSLACLSKVFEDLMSRQMEAYIQRNEFLTVFQSGFHRHHSTTAAVLKVLEDI
jgi:small basic protein